MTDNAPQNDRPRNDRQGQRPQGNRPALTWSHAQTFSDPKSGTAVVVSKSSGNSPMFSFQIGRVREDGSVATNLQFRTNRNSATFELETDQAAVIAALMVKAQEFVVTDMQWNWSLRMDDQIARESRRLDGGQPKPGGDTIRHPGKTARDKAKHARK